MAGYDNDRLNDIFNKTDGHCFHCGKKLAFSNYGKGEGARGAWEVDHSKPISRGGTDHLNNLNPSCWSCNRSKGNKTTREFSR